MAITLDALTLPDDLLWSDEIKWDAIVQRVSHTLTGALRVRESVKQAGRPITLVLPAEKGDCERSLVLTLHDLSQLSGQHVLTLHNARSFNVRWRRSDGPSVDADPVRDYADPSSNDQYSLILRFIEV
ncbi:MAG: hypothetical protein KDJ99_20300 [Candidatus Competibacteraceae bacterium]|nr:hypothetical protein [Candidatus Competibacteraceae bacterium]